jgi:hypothetical protein
MNNNENVGCLGFLLKMLGLAPRPSGKLPGTADAAPLPYRVRDDFLSPAERSFYGVLCAAAAGERMVVCPKVGLGDVFFVVQPRENRTAFNRISQKHVDFLLCEPGTMRPRLGVELDDSSHARPDRQARDAFVEDVFRAANLPLLRVPTQQGYSLSELTARIDSLLNGLPAVGDGARSEDSAPPVLVVTPEKTPPLCPKCGVVMVLRTAKQGDRAGKPFYGCSNYPRCRQTVFPADAGSA